MSVSTQYEPRDVIRVCLSVDEDGYAPIHVDEAVLTVGADSIEVTVPHTHFTVTVYYRDVHQLELVKPHTRHTIGESSNTSGAGPPTRNSSAPQVQLVFHTGIFSHRRYILSSVGVVASSGTPALMEMLYEVLRDRIIERDVSFPRIFEPTHAALMGRYFGTSSSADTVDPRAVWVVGNDGVSNRRTVSAGPYLVPSSTSSSLTVAALGGHSPDVSAIRGASPQPAPAAVRIAAGQSTVTPTVAAAASTAAAAVAPIRAPVEADPPLRMWATPPPTRLTAYSTWAPHDLSAAAPGATTAAEASLSTGGDPYVPKRSVTDVRDNATPTNAKTTATTTSMGQPPSPSSREGDAAAKTSSLPPRPNPSTTRGSPLRGGYPTTATPTGQRSKSDGRTTTADAAVHVVTYTTEADTLRQPSVILSPPATASVMSPVGGRGVLPAPPPQGPVLSPPPPVWLLKRNLKEMEHRDALLHTPPQTFVATTTTATPSALPVGGSSFLLRNAVQQPALEPFSLFPTPNVLQSVAEIKARSEEFRLGSYGGEHHRSTDRTRDGLSHQQLTSPLSSSAWPAASSASDGLGVPLHFAGDEMRSLDGGASSGAVMPRQVSPGYDGAHDEYFESASYTAPTATTTDHHGLRPTTESQDAASEIEAADRRLRSLASVAALDTKRTKLQRDDVLITVARRAATSPRVLPLPQRRAAPPPTSAANRDVRSIGVAAAAPPLPASHSARRDRESHPHGGQERQEQRLSKTYTGIAMVREGTIIMDDQSSDGGEGFGSQGATTATNVERRQDTSYAVETHVDRDDAAAATAGREASQADVAPKAAVSTAAGEIEQPRRIPVGPYERPAVRRKTIGGVPMPHLVAAAAAAAAATATGHEESVARYQSARPDVGAAQLMPRR